MKNKFNTEISVEKVQEIISNVVAYNKKQEKESNNGSQQSEGGE